ncbi:transketolase [Trinickia caryophylli]|uniref:Transketolase n=1 Tax=Trinickia caryophylli TaxID=28094 RepID=A0A1X7E3J7_TRICW|nr:transketolase [Trinickia caryophylli]PMS14288.1 transketolase [Trinickia caryophylli]TRX17721.1 transketolase [Trinickia caryophylli]WQE11519.1 transketolase [Trinickia caryophylli]SMF26173.1 transketolase [Trinickia caryophylli]GLU32685.1 transketolase [Trinickia caryophylli]
MNAAAEPSVSSSSATARMANALRMLAIDAVQQANSGHPGMPLGMAEIAVALWDRHLKHNPRNPHWPDRDRFVLSNGHGSMLLYALLHLTGYELPIDELQRFRQLHAKTPGHPEVGVTPGVETTTGPLGQGLANAVGMALAEALLAREFNRPGHRIVDHRTYAFVGDGCLMEGISQEAISLAGTLRLEKLAVLYDDNGISIDGHVEGWFADDTPGRFAACGWHVVRDVDGHDVEAVDRAIAEARGAGRPTLICCRTVIGRGAPTKAGTHDVHGAPLGAAEIAATRAALGWSHPPFAVPQDVHALWDATVRGAQAEAQWTQQFAAYREQYPREAAEFERRTRGALPESWEAARRMMVHTANDAAQSIATRKASQLAIEALAASLPELLGGSADLTGSNLTNWSSAKTVRVDASGLQGGNYLHYGVREFGMCAVMNGVALHRGYLPFGGTFLTFSDYARNALRMAALMKTRTVFVFTHDSIGLGEDGPTHQPIEHAASLRLVPGLDVWRPCDTVETVQAWASAVERAGPSCLLLSRQNLPFVARGAAQIEAIAQGGYVLRDWPQSDAARQSAQVRRVVLIATGSEVALALAALEPLAREGVAARVVSMPSTTVFDRQSAAYRDAVLPPGVPRVAVEAGVTGFWRQYVGLEGAVVGIDTFGESAPAGALFAHFGLTAQAVADAACRVAAP